MIQILKLTTDFLARNVRHKRIASYVHKAFCQAFAAAIALVLCFCVVALVQPTSSQANPEINSSTSENSAAPLESASPVAKGSPARSAPSAATAGAASSPAALAASKLGVVPARLLPHDLSPWQMFLSAASVVKGVMALLTFASVLTWTVCLSKSLELARAKRRVRLVIGVLAQAASLDEVTESLPNGSGPAGGLLAAADDELKMSADLSVEGIKERIAIRLERIEVAARQAISRGIGLLATIGSVAPFVGLFGTVWGIMDSFIGISKAQTTNLAIVAPGIAEALLATALGLVAAIPAVVIYNAFARSITGYRTLLEDVSAQVLRLVSRELDQPREKASSLAKAAR
ncbi:MAG: tonB-system energizer ExbB [Deltaproteobacteria bacterium]|nr:tonB-system energizer ExbB [Deltaproteobacteria bacterium]